MPLYMITDSDRGLNIDNDRKRMIYAKTPRGAITRYLAFIRNGLEIDKLSPIEAAIHASEGVQIECMGQPENIMADDPPAIARGHHPHLLAAVDDT